MLKELRESLAEFFKRGVHAMRNVLAIVGGVSLVWGYLAPVFSGLPKVAPIPFKEVGALLLVGAFFWAYHELRLRYVVHVQRSKSAATMPESQRQRIHEIKRLAGRISQTVRGQTLQDEELRRLLRELNDKALDCVEQNFVYLSVEMFQLAANWLLLSNERSDFDYSKTWKEEMQKSYRSVLNACNAELGDVLILEPPERQS